ncbi:hypothetical protein [Arcobacter sp. FWKO B]|uniref:hypothetical protein n=1 Tax=Arcobacter sp. FWKO B TaxID=2593672 RepID=UPI0018A48729|nr:hypothetical protein [Arcobacter sp. FWKO B]QOG12533.1 hypothetical protein FWKOB_07375 [Arcobacter sp. FWKO B]
MKKIAVIAVGMMLALGFSGCDKKEEAKEVQVLAQPAQESVVEAEATEATEEVVTEEVAEETEETTEEEVVLEEVAVEVEQAQSN